jgi:hypothetical protein
VSTSEYDESRSASFRNPLFANLGCLGLNACACVNSTHAPSWSPASGLVAASSERGHDRLHRSYTVRRTDRENLILTITLNDDSGLTAWFDICYGVEDIDD